MGSKYLMFPSGELHINTVRQEDSEFTYRCQCMDHLAGRTLVSNTAGRLVITGVAPRLIHRQNLITARENSVAMIPCAAEGFPSVTIKWYKQHSSSSLSPVQEKSDRIQKRIDGTLIISNAVAGDIGAYLCTASNAFGEQKSITQLNVVHDCALKKLFS
ncbi:down syndrome cell adhesion molecule 1:-like isoform BL [Dinothrombium tinctorium]|uniref:Down syndrome cell adhesion molecule 1:-like isoform BL n=1 Tax=Dinothrombium tinctorium TaxID=1965070 RepID=A0A3S3PED0_9ACAR|nr:down syndrome cell adhesion molecule 1:-like isoform BL [Dinothrombium tinctorium]